MDPLVCLSGIHAVVAALASESEEDLRLGGPDRLAEQLLALQRAQELLQAQLLRRVVVFERTNGYRAARARSTKSFLAQHAQLTGHHARALVDTARRLETVPAVGAAFAAGELSADQAGVIARELAPVDDEHARAQGAAFLITQAPALHLDQLSRVSKELRARLAEEDHTEPKPRKNWLRLAQTGTSDDPFWVVTGELSATCGEKLRTALEALMDEPSPEPGAKPHGQRMGDALDVMATQALNAGTLPVTGGQRPHLTVIANLDNLQDCPTHPALDTTQGLLRPDRAETHRGSTLTRAEVRRIACDCALRVILTDRQGRPMSIGRAARTVPAHLRDAVTARDRHCAWPGCQRPPTWCEAHHLTHWADGGQTSLDNLALLCGEHHGELHATGWELRMVDGRPTPVPPDGYRPPPNTRHPQLT